MTINSNETNQLFKDFVEYFESKGVHCCLPYIFIDGSPIDSIQILQNLLVINNALKALEGK